MKRILGLDIGVSSVGAAIIKDEQGKKEIEKLAVRIVPEDPDFHGKFYSGNTASKNLDRTIKRGVRRNNQRFKARRDKLYTILKMNKMFPSESLFELPSLDLYGLRAKSVTEKVSLEELGRILILLNQRRGFLSNRKSISEEENSTEYKERIAALENELGGKTIGQRLYSELQNEENPYDTLIRERTYQRSSYIEEFDRIWDEQKKHHPILTGGSQEEDSKGTLYDRIKNKTIFYQRALKSQKSLISECPFEKYHKAITKSSPYFELFRIWQKVNDLSWKTPNGESFVPSFEQKKELKEALWYGEELNKQYKLSVSKIKKLLGFERNDRIYLNFTELDGSRTYRILYDALTVAGVENPEKFLFFNLEKNDEKGGLFELWHITYSLPTDKEVISALMKRFGFTEEQSKHISRKVGYPSDYGSLSTRAIRKLLPYLEKGLAYSDACDKVGYDHSGYKTEIELRPKLDQLQRNSLRNPVVEQILNQVVNVVNLVIDQYGPIDEIRVEMARELRNSAKRRKSISSLNRINKKNNDRIRKELKEKYGFKLVNGRDVKRFILWKETVHECLYCNNPISGTDMLSGNADIEHILPKSRSFNNAMSNYIIAHRTCNTDKGQRTAYDFMASKGEEQLYQYVSKVNDLYKDGNGSINRIKFDNLLCKGEDIPSDFVERMKKDSQYIAKESVKMLQTVCPNVFTTTGQVTDFLRDEWELKHLLQELTFDTYKAIGQVEEKTIKTNGQTKTFERIKDWSKRDDHRHHAIDALICALTNQKIIYKLNNLNKIYQYEKGLLTHEELKNYEEFLEEKFSLKKFAENQIGLLDCEIPDVREQARKHLKDIFVSIKKENNKVLTKTINRTKNNEPQVTWVPRARLHEDTVMGQVKRVAEKKVKLNKLTLVQLKLVVNPQIKHLLQGHLLKYENNLKLAFSSKSLKKEPLLYKKEPLTEVQVFEYINTKRVELNENITPAQINKIIDLESKRVVEEHLNKHEGKINQAFKNVSENPLRLKNGMLLKRVTVSDESKVEKVRDGYVITGKNHHALIYLDEEGNFNDKVVSFWDAVKIGLLNIDQTKKPTPIIERKNDALLGVFQFSMQINDLFVFDLRHSNNPVEENEIDFFEKKNRKLISEKLFRVQKMSKSAKGRFLIDFRHHLETTVTRNDLKLKNITWLTISKNADLERLTKIRINHLGEIIKIGE